MLRSRGRTRLTRCWPRVDGEPTQTTCAISWVPVRHAEAYEARLSPDAAVAVEGTTARLGQLRPSTAYVFEVRATSSDDAGTWCECAFTTAVCDTLALIADDLPQLQRCAETGLYGCCDAADMRYGTFGGSVHACYGAVIRVLAPRGQWRVGSDGALADAALAVHADGRWWDANAMHTPWAGGGCLVRSPDALVRRITFGGRLLSGEVRVRIGLTGDGRRLAGLTLVGLG